MRVLETKVFTFGELSEEAKSLALESMADINVDYEWWDFTGSEIASYGGELKEFDIGRGQYCKISCNDWGAFAASIIENHGKQCETYKTASLFLDNKIDEGEFKEQIRNDYLNLLEQEYEYLVGDEAVIGTIEANEIEFYENGKPY